MCILLRKRKKPVIIKLQMRENDVNYLSAKTILVLVVFSMVNLVFPPFPAIRPIALDKWSPLSGFTLK